MEEKVMARKLKKKETLNEMPIQKGSKSRSKILKSLMAKRTEVQETLDRLMEEQREYKNLASDHYLIDEMDHAEREISSQTHYILLERKSRELKKIEDLIGRALEDEEFGLCEECGEKIPEARLMIMPEATRCVPCQQEIEQTGSRIGFVESPRAKLGGKSGLQWGITEDTDVSGKLNFKSDLGGLSFLDSDEFDLGDHAGTGASSGPGGASTNG
jgi:RNA polymerase-binding protein DksA